MEVKKLEVKKFPIFVPFTNFMVSEVPRTRRFSQIFYSSSIENRIIENMGQVNDLNQLSCKFHRQNIKGGSSFSNLDFSTKYPEFTTIMMKNHLKSCFFIKFNEFQTPLVLIHGFMLIYSAQIHFVGVGAKWSPHKMSTTLFLYLTQL